MSGGWKNSISERILLDKRKFNKASSSTEVAAVVNNRFFSFTENTPAVVTAVALSITIAGSTPTVSHGIELSPDAGSYSSTGASPTLTQGHVLTTVRSNTAVAGDQPSLGVGHILAPTSLSVDVTGQQPILIQTVNITPSNTLNITVSGSTPTIYYGRVVTAFSGTATYSGDYPVVSAGWADGGASLGSTITGATASYSVGAFIRVLDRYIVTLNYSIPTYNLGHTLTPIADYPLVEGATPDLINGRVFGVTTWDSVIIAGDISSVSAGAAATPTSNNTIVDGAIPTHTVTEPQAVNITEVISLDVPIGLSNVIVSAGVKCYPTRNATVVSGKYPEVVYSNIFVEYIDLPISISETLPVAINTTSFAAFSLSYDTFFSVSTSVTQNLPTSIEITKKLEVPLSITKHVPITTEI